jgi:hypothetical protein
MPVFYPKPGLICSTKHSTIFDLDKIRSSIREISGISSKKAKPTKN